MNISIINKKILRGLAGNKTLKYHFSSGNHDFTSWLSTLAPNQAASQVSRFILYYLYKETTGRESGETLTTATVSAIQCNRAVIKLNWLRLLLHRYSRLFFSCSFSFRESTDSSHQVISIAMWLTVLFLRQYLGQAACLE